MQWFLKALSQYADFKGRARRKEYWMFYLFYVIFGLAVTVLDILLFGTAIYSWGLLYLVYFFALLIPYIAVSVRRLHDIGKSGWWLLIMFIPIAGIIWLIVLLATDGEKGENKWGTNPKEISE